jgi:hypothetical protein
VNEGRLPPDRSPFEVRWRQLRSPPPPVVRAVLANLGVALFGALVLLVYGLVAPDADLTPWVVGFVVVVIIAGSLLTYLWVELPTGSGTERRRSAWAAVLGFFAAVPIAYLVLVVLFQVIRPLLGQG